MKIETENDNAKVSICYLPTASDEQKLAQLMVLGAVVLPLAEPDDVKAVVYHDLKNDAMYVVEKKDKREGRVLFHSPIPAVRKMFEQCLAELGWEGMVEQFA